MGKYKSDWAKANNISRYKAWRLANPEKDRLSKRAWYDKNKSRICEIEKYRSLLKLYGITKEEYEKMLEEHLNKCAICGKEAKDCAKGLCVDHDHVTGKIRGLLCMRCNSSLGWYEKHKKGIKSYLK